MILPVIAREVSFLPGALEQVSDRRTTALDANSQRMLTRRRQ